MESFMKEFEHLKIHLEDLKKATNSFGNKVIGVGGFGKVYEGEISHSKGRSLVAIKRLSREFGQGDPEFLKEIMMLSRYSHENLITLLGYCDEDGEKILVYEHASNGSLDRHLSSNVLTWAQRLKICLDAAKGLKYLHDHRGTQQRILHRDIKSANILLDDNWNAKLSDMGLSKVGPANQQHSVLVTNVVGTPGYCDPQYMETYTLTKESDIYSFGVVLFEVLCGKLCFKTTNSELEILVPMWKQNYIHKKLDRIIFKDLTLPMDPTSLETFSEIAFQCLHYSREQRPTTSLLVKKLGIALKCQERHDMKLTNVVGKYEKYNYFDELLSKGKEVFLNLGKTKREGTKRKDAEGNAIAPKEAAAPSQADAASKTERETVVHFDGTEISFSSHFEAGDSEEDNYHVVDYIDTPFPTVESLQITGEPYPGNEIQASGYSRNGTTSCRFEWVRYLQDGSVKHIEGAKGPMYIVSADDLDNYLAIVVRSLDDRRREGEFMKCFANDNKKITCHPDMLREIEKSVSVGHSSVNLFVLRGYPDAWEPAILEINKSGYSIKLNGPNNGVVVADKYTPTTIINLSAEEPLQFSILGPKGVERYLSVGHNSTSISRSRDTIVLTMRWFVKRAVDKKLGKKKRRGLFF